MSLCHTETVDVLKRPIHVSWLIALLCFAFVIGVWLALFIHFTAWHTVAAAGLVLVGAFWRSRLYSIPFIFIGGGIVGLFFGSAVRGDLEIYAPLFGKHITLTGRVKEDPVLNDRKQLVIQCDGIVIAERELPGSVWVSLIGSADIKRGDVVVVSGELSEGFGTFVGVMYTAKIKSITRPSPGDIGRVVRDWFAGAVRGPIPEPQASLGIGYLTGQKSALPSDLSEALQIAGLSHVVVASGYNLTILVRLARRLFMRISKYVSALASSIMIVCFMAITGLSPSMTRAGLISGLSLATWYYGRRFHPFVLLPFAAAVTVLFQPSYVWGDLGWQLSFSAFAGVMIVAPLLQRFFFGDASPGTLRQILGETVAAHILTIPLIVMSFGVISHVAIIANLLIVPLVPLAMLMTFIVGVVVLLIPSIASIVAFPATLLLTYMTSAAQYLADLPWSQTEVKGEWWMLVSYYVVLIALCIYMAKASGFKLREVNIVE